LAKTTCVIDIGSNSARMSIFRKTSRFAFHIVKEIKLTARISEGCYLNDGILGDEPMRRTINAVSSFVSIAKMHKANKILTFATSALRTAPNAKDFKALLKKKTNISLKIIDEHKEAYLGGIAVINLLPLKNGITIDTGGGSTDICIIKNHKVEKTISLNLGCINIKEKFFDGDDEDKISLAKKYINKIIKQHIEPNNEIKNIVLIGGSARAFSKALMPKSYPIRLMHGFKYKFSDFKILKNKIMPMTKDELSLIGITKERLDSIKSGTLVIYETLKYLKAKNITISGVGVREGLFLSDILKAHNNTFSRNFNTGIRSIRDKFIFNEKELVNAKKISNKLFDLLLSSHNLEEDSKKYLYYSMCFFYAGAFINSYRPNKQSSYLAINQITFGLTHKEKALIHNIVRFAGKKIIQEKHLQLFEDLVDIKEVQWLGLLVSIAINLNIDSNKKIELNVKNNQLIISSKEDLSLEKRAIDKLKIDSLMEIKFT